MKRARKRVSERERDMYVHIYIYLAIERSARETDRERERKDRSIYRYIYILETHMYIHTYMYRLVDRHQPQNRDGDRQLVRWKSRRPWERQSRPSEAVGAADRKGVKFLSHGFFFVLGGSCGFQGGFHFTKRFGYPPFSLGD